MIEQGLLNWAAANGDVSEAAKVTDAAGGTEELAQKIGCPSASVGLKHCGNIS